MLYAFDMTQMPTCTRFGRMMQKNRWNRRGTAQKNVNLLVYIVSGSAFFAVDGEEISVSAGDVLLIPANTPYMADTIDMCDYYFFHFTGEMVPIQQLPTYPKFQQDFSFDLPGVTERCIGLKQKTTPADDFPQFYQCITACVDLHATGSFSGRLALDLELGRLLLLLSQILERQSNETAYPMVLSKMLEYIRKNLTRSFTASDLCQYCEVSPSYGARLFKRYLNTTMTQYITDQKLSYACELMRNTGMNISQIASYLGFCDVFYFSRRFKEKYGKAPTKMFSRQ